MARTPKTQTAQPLTKAQQAEADLKDNFQQFAAENFPSFCEAYKKLPPKDACKVYTDILKYITAPVQAQPLDSNSPDTDSDSVDKHKARLLAMRDGR